MEALDVTPDLVIMAKVIGGGYAPGCGAAPRAGHPMAIKFVAARASRRAFPAGSDVAGSIWRGMLERGFILPSRRSQDSAVIGDDSLLAPAFVISEAEIRDGITALKDTIDAVAARW